MAELGRKAKRSPSDRTDEEGARIEPLLPKLARQGRKPAVDLRDRLHGTQRGRVADAAGAFRPVADGPLVVPALRPAAAVPQHS
jgi:transposase